MPARASPHSVDVVVVSTNAETLEGLHAYLLAAGIGARCTRRLERCTSSVPGEIRAFVVFPDDFAAETVLATLAEIAEKRPRALSVLVTAHPKRFAGMIDVEKIVLVPRPAWGWTILEAIRGHVAGEEEEP